ncbi:hypothetical protein MCHI_001095 [Candidatus Magnetoovum chiemensis]|nr:hypothetical protein MCHI_001095 [Candidatus Magnetoovum chiemensis]
MLCQNFFSLPLLCCLDVKIKPKIPAMQILLTLLLLITSSLLLLPYLFLSFPYLLKIVLHMLY